MKHKIVTRLRWVARIISLLPGTGMILGYLGFNIGLFFRKGVFYWYALGYELRMPAIFLAIGGIAWRWPLVGGIIMIPIAVYFLAVAWDTDMDPVICLPLGVVLLAGGILNIIISPWRRRLPK
jgi:uncharacterized membrane protein